MKKKINSISTLFEYIFEPWDIEVIEQGEAEMSSFDPITGKRFLDSERIAIYVIYKYTHKFFNKEKIKRVIL